MTRNNIKIITRDYHAGISPSVLDAIPNNVIIVEKNNYKWLFNYEWSEVNIIIFLGHDFLSFLWDRKKKIKYWKDLSVIKIVWCFERIRCFVDEWRKKSLQWFENIKEFADHIFVTDEEDFRGIENVKFLPQWASPRFVNKKPFGEKIDQFLFTGQLGTVGYERRTELLERIRNDPLLSKYCVISNSKRIFTWDYYIDNIIKYKYLINPIGNLISFNTRAYETILSGNVLFQQIDDRFQIHRKMFKDWEEIIYFTTFEEFKEKFFSVINSKDAGLKIHLNTKKIVNDHIVYPRLDYILRAIGIGVC